ncbi:unnamed protein product [Amoebophrya sp. A25]|nr:unnamed protein product [Amoebophrya sp. A25]|eukprot:GSA25T00010888001.1
MATSSRDGDSSDVCQVRVGSTSTAARQGGGTVCEPKNTIDEEWVDPALRILVRMPNDAILSHLSCLLELTQCYRQTVDEKICSKPPEGNEQLLRPYGTRFMRMYEIGPVLLPWMRQGIRPGIPLLSAGCFVQQVAQKARWDRGESRWQFLVEACNWVCCFSPKERRRFRAACESALQRCPRRNVGPWMKEWEEETRALLDEILEPELDLHLVHEEMHELFLLIAKAGFSATSRTRLSDRPAAMRFAEHGFAECVAVELDFPPFFFSATQSPG